MTERDYADEEVKGLERYLPTPWSKRLLVMAILAPEGVFAYFRGHSEWFPILKSSLEQTLLALLASAIVEVLLLICLVINLSVINYQSKHRRISHYNTHHPLMSFPWLISHLETIHWLLLALICTVCFYLGYYVSHL